MNNPILSNVDAWNFWGRWVFSTFGNAPWNYYSCGQQFKKLNLPPSFTGNAVNIDGYVYGLKADHSVFETFILDKIKNDLTWFDAFFSACESTIQSLNKLKAVPDLKKMLDLYEDLACNSMIIHFCDRALEPAIPELGLAAGLSSSDIAHLLVPHQPTIMMQYKTALRNLSDAGIDAFLGEYQWVGANYLTGKRLTGEDVMREKQNIEKESETLHSSLAALDEKTKKQFMAIQKLIYYRSVDAETLNKSLNWHWELFDALAKKHGLTRGGLDRMAPFEVRALIEEGKAPADIANRTDRNGMTCIDRQFKLYYGKGLEEMLTIFEHRANSSDGTVSGRVAFKGKVRGIACIIQNIRDLDKIEEGDIIVANETMPEYIVGMKKAAAFITNQGGITSHAAIVARELSKPCIIATKIATKIFKDGDLIEVDAIVGKATLIKRA